MFKKGLVVIGIFAYLYTLTFDIFLSHQIRIPSPVLIGIPLFFFAGKRNIPFLYFKEVVVFFLVFFFYFLIGQGDLVSFIKNLLVIAVCSVYFNYVVHNDISRFNISVGIVIGLLILSSMVLFYNQSNLVSGDRLRAKLLTVNGILQSPSGIAMRPFTFGYQIAALTSFLFTYVLIYKKNFVLASLSIAFCLGVIYFGMNRSVLLTFSVTSILFILIYYKKKASLIVSAVALGAFLIAQSVQFTDTGDFDNIFAKNQRNQERGTDRGNLQTENLIILADYPLGLIFYGKDWFEVTRGNRVFGGDDALSSHNAYLMFITFLGPFLGGYLLYLLYKRIFLIGYQAIKNIDKTANRLSLCLFLGFLGISMNAWFHNACLMEANGPTLFLYFAILHLHRRENLDTHTSIHKQKKEGIFKNISK